MDTEKLTHLLTRLRCVVCGGRPNYVGVYVCDDPLEQIRLVATQRHRTDVVDTPDGLAYALCAEHAPGSTSPEAVEAVLFLPVAVRGAGKSETLH